jgi:hypothetical protein
MTAVLAWQIAVAHYVSAVAFGAFCALAIVLQLRAVRGKR